MNYPKDAIAVSKRGEKEVRVLMGEGRCIAYGYKKIDGGKLKKYSVLLELEEGVVEHLLIIPLKGKELVVKHEKEREVRRGVWDEKKNEVVYFP